MALDKSKYSYISEDKLDDMYFSTFLRELYSVPLQKFNEYVKNFYPNPSVSELIELRHLEKIIKKLTPDKDGVILGLSEEDEEIIRYRHNRMWGKERQVIEISGSERSPLRIQDMTNEEIDKQLKEKLADIAKAIVNVEKTKDGA